MGTLRASCHTAHRRASAMLSRRGRRRRRWAAVRKRRRRPRESNSCSRKVSISSRYSVAPDSDGLLGFFEDVSASQVVESELLLRASPEFVTKHTLPLALDAKASTCSVPADGPGGCPEGWDFNPKDSSWASKSKRPQQDAVEEEDASIYPHLQEYLSSRPSEPQRRQQADESRRYYGGASGSSSATQTDDGYLTKFGSRKVCIICLGQDHKARECPNLRCFTCFEAGHETRQCPKHQLKCGKCGRKGHDREGCVWDALVDAARCSNWYGVRCANCGKFGHPMCSREARWKDPLAETAISKTVSKEQSSAKPTKHNGANDDRWHEKNSRRKHNGASDHRWHETNGWRKHNDASDDRRHEKNGWRKHSDASDDRIHENNGWRKYNDASSDRWHEKNDRRRRSDNGIAEIAAGPTKKKRKISSTADAKYIIDNGREHNGHRKCKKERVESLPAKDLRAELRAKLANQHGRNGGLGKENFHSKMNSHGNGTAFLLHESLKRSRSATAAAATARHFR